MDILTPRGQVSLAHELRAAELLESRWPDFQYVSTPKEEPADIDALLVSKSVLRGIVETKCRDMSLKAFKTRFQSRWLVTAEKLDRAAWLSHSLRVPFVGCLYLIQDDTLLVQSLTNNVGEWVVDVRFEKTLTQRTVNGGAAERVNGFIDMRYAECVRGVVQKETPA